MQEDYHFQRNGLIELRRTFHWEGMRNRRGDFEYMFRRVRFWIDADVFSQNLWKKGVVGHASNACDHFAIKRIFWQSTLINMTKRKNTSFNVIFLTRFSQQPWIIKNPINMRLVVSEPLQIDVVRIVV